jgi:hypothetical protein
MARDLSALRERKGCIKLDVTEQILPWWRRVGLAFGVFFRILFNGRYAQLLAQFAASLRSSSGPAAAARAMAPSAPLVPALDSPDSALVLLAMLQSEGRFVDFVQQDITAYEDADVGAVARVVQSGCRKVLREHLRIEPIRGEPEGQAVTLEPGFDPSRIKLTGNVTGKGRLEGVLRHRGWQALDVHLPTLVDREASQILCPAEVEL